MSFLWFSVKRVNKSFRDFDLSEYPESKLVVRQPIKFRTFNQIKLAYANISEGKSTRKPRLLFNKKSCRGSVSPLGQRPSLCGS